MDEEIKRSTILVRLQREFEMKNQGETVLIRVFLEDFPSEMEMDFKELGEIMRKMGRENPSMIKIESVDNLSTDPDLFLDQPSILTDQFRLNKAFYRVRYGGKKPSRESIKTPRVYLDRGMVYVAFNSDKVKIGGKNSRQAKLLTSLRNPDNDEIGIRKNIKELFENIKINTDKDVQKTPEEWKQVIKDTLGDINKKIHKKNEQITLSIEYLDKGDIAQLKLKEWSPF